MQSRGNKSREEDNVWLLARLYKYTNFFGPNKGSFVGRWLPPMRDGLDSSFSAAGPNLDSADGPISPHRQEMAAFHQ